MFIRKSEYEEMQNKLEELKQDNELLNKILDNLQKNNARLRKDLDNEHLENYKNHKVLLAIKKMYNTSYGTITALIQFRKDVKKELDNADNID